MSLLSPEVASTYEILEEMGEGGMGAVYKVRHRVFGEVCVIKVMRAELHNNDRLRQRFESEARKGKQLDHPNIARVLNFFVGGNGNPHLVMEYVGGVNLAQVMRLGKPLGAETVVAIGTQALAALGCMHSRKLIHRDISPDNLMIAKDAEGQLVVKLIDLGIAKSLEEGTSYTDAGTFIGKYVYASPEQFGDPVDGRSDLYSMGVVLYELLTTALPIIGTSFSSFALAHASRPPLPFAETDPQSRVPDSLRRVVLKALEKLPENRFQTAEEFAAALRATLPARTTPTIVIPNVEKTAPVPRPQPAAPPTVPTTPPRGIRPTKVIAIAAATIAVLATIALGITKLRPTERWVEQPPASSSTTLTVTAATTDGKERVGELMRKGKQLIVEGNTQAAYDVFREARQLDPSNAGAWTSLGGAAALLGRPEEASRAYHAALAIDDSYWLAHYNLACQLARGGRKDEALAELETAVRHMRRQSASDAEAEGVMRNIRADVALKELRNEPRFRDLVGAP